MALKLIEYGSPDYQKMLNLRYEVLRKPLGLKLNPEKLEKEKDDILIGAFEEDDLLACCILAPIDENTIKLRQMAVINNLQGKGMGRAMMNYAELIARDKGYKRLVMHEF